MRSRLWIKRMIVLFSIFMMIGLGKIIVVEAADTTEEETKLTDEFLTGTWIDKEGLVCDYKSGDFIDSNGMFFYDCKVNSGTLTGTSSKDKTVSTTTITIVDEDTIQVDGYTAVRADSKLGKECQGQFAELLIGKWLYYMENYECYMEFKKDNSLIQLVYGQAKYNYEVVGGGIKIHYADDNRDDDEDGRIFLRIHENTLRMGDNNFGRKLYREGSITGTAAQSGKIDVIGDWIFVSEDGKPISEWKFDSSDILTIDYFGKEKDVQQPFSTSRQNDYIAVKMGEKSYILSNVYSLFFEVSGDIEGLLFRKDSEEGKYFTEKAKTIYSAGEMLQRSQNKKFSDDLCPEVTAVSVSLQCMSNLWLDDLINIDAYYSSSDQIGICGFCYKIASNIKLKNAKITFTYDESKLPHASEKDLVIVRMDEKTGKKTVLKTTRNMKSNKVSAKIMKDGFYYLADSVVVNGGIRAKPIRKG